MTSSATLFKIGSDASIATIRARWFTVKVAEAIEIV
jgi:hypothetical protein